MLIAAHPNCENHLLIFPPMGKDPANLLYQVSNDGRILAYKVQLARMSNQDQLLLVFAESSGHFVKGNEELLDWKYPVYTLSTQKVIEHSGRSFRNFRHSIHLANKNGLSATCFDLQKDKTTLLNLVKTWAENTAQEGYSKEDLTAPTCAIIELMETSDLPLHGLIVKKEGNPVGFMTWEETNEKESLANSMCGLSIEDKGVAEFIYLSMSKILYERGFEYLCIGGCETKGLDAFKRKMNPISSVPLKSAFPSHRLG